MMKKILVLLFVFSGCFGAFRVDWRAAFRDLVVEMGRLRPLLIRNWEPHLFDPFLPGWRGAGMIYNTDSVYGELKQVFKSEQSDSECVEFLLGKLRTCSQDELRHFFLFAAHVGSVCWARYVLDCGLNVNYSLLPAVVGSGMVRDCTAPIVALLIERGADIRVDCYNGALRYKSTLLHIAAKAGFIQAYNLLVQAGLDPHAPDAEGAVPAQALAEFQRLTNEHERRLARNALPFYQRCTVQ